MAYASSFSFTDFYVTQGAAADDLNAGTMYTGGGQTYTNDGPCETYANCDVAAGAPLRWDIDNNNGGAGWGTTAVGDYVRIDTAGTKELGIVTALAVGADPDVIEVRSALAAGITQPVNAKNCNVGGAFEHAQAAADLLEALSNEDTIGPVRINIKRHAGNPYDEAFDIDTNAGTALRPITVEGYNTAPGDIDWTTSTDRTKFLPTAVAGTAVIYVDEPFIRLLNLDCETAVAAKHGFHVDALGDKGVMLNCRGKGTTNSINVNGNAQDYIAARCLFEDGTDTARFNASYGRFLSNIVRGGSVRGLYTTASYAAIAGNLIYDNAGDGVLAFNNIFTRTVCVDNIIADNGGDGIDLGTEADLESNVITGNIIAHNGGWGIAGTATNGRFAVLDYNMLYGNTTGAVQDIEAGGDLIDNSLHDDETNAPFTGANAAARAANFYELTAAAEGIQQYFADTNFDTWPDAGSAQVQPRTVQLVGGGLAR